MAILFYVVGTLLAIFGVGWCGLVLAQPTDTSGIGIIAKLLVMAPAFGVIGTSFVFFAVAGILSRLDTIAANTGRPVRQQPVDTSRWSQRDREAHAEAQHEPRF